jgi:pilus assembly protein Flp/PilA
MLKKLLKNRKGAAIVEYSLLVAGVALICAASIATFGHKTNDMIGTVAAIIPGAHIDDNSPIGSARIIETTNTGGTAGKSIVLDIVKITTNSDGTKGRLGDNLGMADGTKLKDLVTEVP